MVPVLLPVEDPLIPSFLAFQLPIIDRGDPPDPLDDKPTKLLCLDTNSTVGRWAGTFDDIVRDACPPLSISAGVTGLPSRSTLR